jgi:hypothetical protein
MRQTAQIGQRLVVYEKLTCPEIGLHVKSVNDEQK